MKKVIIFGTGELAQRVFFYLKDSDDELVAFCANKSKIDKNFQKSLSNSIVTEIVKIAPFYLAEDYHQCYIQKINQTAT